MDKKRTLVIGASGNPARYSYLAVNKLTAYGHPVFAIGKRAARINDIEIIIAQKPFKDIDTVTLYLNSANQKIYYDYILSLHPGRIIFNPGAENEELFELALKKGIIAQEACTLVLLSTDQY